MICPVAVLALAGPLCRAGDLGGVFDPSFDVIATTGIGQFNAIQTVRRLSDDRLLIAGNFEAVNGAIRNGFAILKPDLGLDPTFVPDKSLRIYNLQPSSTVPMPDGGVLINSDQNVIHLMPDGSLDPNLDVNARFGSASLGLYAIAVQSDGQISIGGNSFFRRYDTNGVLETEVQEFMTINCITAASDGSLWIGGSISDFKGTSVDNLVRLMPDGSPDSTLPAFNLGSINQIAVEASGDVLTLEGNVIHRLHQVSSSDWSVELLTNKVPFLSVNTVLPEADGKIMIAGTIDATNDAPPLVRLNADGSLDTSFNAPSIANSGLAYKRINSVAQLADGTYAIGGDFLQIDNQQQPNFALLDASGRLLNAPEVSVENVGTINEVAISPDGDMIVGGDFNRINGLPHTNLARLNPSGELDEQFGVTNAPDGLVNSLVVLPDGKVLVAGPFSTIGDSPSPGIGKLLSDGSVDTSFNVGIGVPPQSGHISDMALDDRGRIVVGGTFVDFAGSGQESLARLSIDGNVDPSFDTGPYTLGFPRSVAIDSAGDVVLGGQLGYLNGLITTPVARLMGDGSSDSGFDPSLVASFGFSAMNVLPDRGLLGLFHTIRSGSTFTLDSGVVRLLSNGRVDSSFAPFLSTVSLRVEATDATVLSDGSFAVAGSFIDQSDPNKFHRSLVRLLPDGTPDWTFCPDISQKFNGTTKIFISQDSSYMLVVGGYGISANTQQFELSRILIMPKPELEVGHPSGQFPTVTVHGGAGHTYQIDSSNDLTDWIPWIELQLQSSSQTLVDDRSDASPHRFYRATGVR